MVRSFRIGPSVFALALSSTLWAQGPSPYQQTVFPTPPQSGAAPKSVNTPKPIESATSIDTAKTQALVESTRPAPITPQPGDRLMTVQEPNRAALVCRIVKSWRMPSGEQAYEVQALETGEMLTIVESGDIAAGTNDQSRLRAVATRIYHWGSSVRAPRGVPTAPPDAVVAMPANGSVAERMPPGDTRYNPSQGSEPVDMVIVEEHYGKPQRRWSGPFSGLRNKETVVEMSSEQGETSPRRPILSKLLNRPKTTVEIETQVATAPEKVEPSKKVEATPVVKTPTAPAHESDWRKSWGKVEPKKLEEPKPESVSSEPSGPPTTATLATERVPTDSQPEKKPWYKREPKKDEAASMKTPPSIAPPLPASKPIEPKKWFAGLSKKTETAKNDKDVPQPPSVPAPAGVEDKVKEAKKTETAKKEEKKPEVAKKEEKKAEKTETAKSEVKKPTDTAKSGDRKFLARFNFKKSDKSQKSEKPEATVSAKKSVDTASASDWGSKGKSGGVLPDSLPRARTTPDVDPLSRPADYARKTTPEAPKSKPVVTESAKPKEQVASAEKAKTSDVKQTATDKVPTPPGAGASETAPKTLPPGSGSVAAAGEVKYIPVPIVTVPNPANQPQVPQAPQPNTHVFHGVAPGVPAPGYANACTKPGPQRPVPSETVPPNDERNAFTDVVDGKGSPPPPVPALVSYVPGRPGGPPMPQYGAPQQMPMHGPNGMQGLPMPQNPTLPMPQHQPVGPPNPQLPMMPEQPMRGNPQINHGVVNQGVPGLAWMQVPGRFVPGYQMNQQPYPVDGYGMPMMQQQGYPQQMMQQPMMHPSMMQQVSMQQMMMQQQMMQQQMPQQQTEPAAGIAGLLQMLRESDYPSQREWAADQLSNSRWQANPQVVNGLLTSAKEDPAPMVRAGCVRALARMQVNTLPVSSTLQQLQADADPRVRDAVADALAAMGVKTDKK